MEKKLTLEEWDNASIKQRQKWLDAGILISLEDAEALTERFKLEQAEYKRKFQDKNMVENKFLCSMLEKI